LNATREQVLTINVVDLCFQLPELVATLFDQILDPLKPLLVGTLLPIIGIFWVIKVLKLGARQTCWYLVSIGTVRNGTKTRNAQQQTEAAT
jgi:hypothetical protein